MIARWGLVGGDGVIGALERALVADRLPPAMLLTGPAHVGKGTLALALARALNCQGEPRPCDECRSCRRIARGQHADVEVIAPGGICRVSDHDHSRSHTIGICAVRRMEAAAAMQPYEGCRRVYIVDPADALTDEAENAFLKTLEEPPPAVTFLLVTERPARLHDTVRSRCQEWTLAPLPVANLATWLATERGVEAETAAVLARLAGGRVGWAITALDEGDPLEVRRTQTEEVGRILASSCADRLTYAQSLAGRGGAEPVNALNALDHWIAWWRDLLRVVTGAAERVTHQNLIEQLRDDATRYRPADVARFLHTLVETREHLRRGVNHRLALEAMLLQTPPAERSAYDG